MDTSKDGVRMDERSCHVVEEVTRNPSWSATIAALRQLAALKWGAGIVWHRRDYLQQSVRQSKGYRGSDKTVLAMRAWDSTDTIYDRQRCGIGARNSRVDVRPWTGVRDYES